MARKAYRSLYSDLNKLKDDSALKDPAAGTGDDDELFELLLSVSDWIDHWCNRHFYPRIQTLTFDGPGGHILLLPDLISVTTLKEDTTDDQTFNEAWAASDYFTWPYNADPTAHWATPITALTLRSAGTKSDFTKGEQTFQIAGSWSYRQFKEDAGTDLNDAAMDTTKTTIAVDDGTQFQIGQTILIGTEQLLITGISSNDLTCARGLNGTTAFAHADSVDIYILRWHCNCREGRPHPDRPHLDPRRRLRAVLRRRRHRHRCPPLAGILPQDHCLIVLSSYFSP